MRTIKITPAQRTAILTALATAIVTTSQALGVHFTASTGRTAIVSGAISILSTLLHAGSRTVKKANQTVTMYDTITPEDIPPQAQAVSGYVNGRWPTFNRAAEMFPRARHLSITVMASADADCLDVENGDATPEECAGWVIRQHKRGKARPWLYCNLSTLPAVLENLKAAGIKRGTFVIWTADPTNKAHITKGADATQWGWHALGRNLDISLVKASAFE